ncbi:MAG: LamG-like jellyroll fold domain-containing protein, partial [Verrucomicrobiota bacterium]
MQVWCEQFSPTYSLWLRVNTWDNGLVNNGAGDYFIDRTTATNPLVSLKAVNDGYGFQVRYDAGPIGGPTGGAIDGDWQHVTMTRHYNNRLQLYVNGVLAGQIADLPNPLTPPIPKLGAHATGPTLVLNGDMDEFRMIGVARSSNWVWASHANFNSNAPLLCLSGADHAWSPVVANPRGATAHTTNGATLHGELLSTGGAPSEVRVYYGLNDGGSLTAAWDSAASLGTQTVGALSLPVTGLLFNTNYFYRYYAVNASGDTWAVTSVPFRTLGPPVIEAAGVSEGNTLNGRFLTPSRGEITLFWGPTDGGTNTAAWAFTNTLGSVTSSTFSITASNLLYGLPYYFQVYATNDYGLDWAADSTVFKTTNPRYRPGLRVREYDTIDDPANLEP